MLFYIFRSHSCHHTMKPITLPSRLIALLLLLPFCLGAQTNSPLQLADIFDM